MRVLQVGPDGKFIDGKIAAKEEGECDHCHHNTWQTTIPSGCGCLCHIPAEQIFKPAQPQRTKR
jgi:hypothetical protein